MNSSSIKGEVIGGAFNFEPSNKTMRMLASLPNWVMSELTKLNFSQIFNTLIMHAEHQEGYSASRDMQLVLVFSDLVHKGYRDLFQSELRKFVMVKNFNPDRFRAVYNSSCFSARKDYKSFLQLLDNDTYTLNVFEMSSRTEKSKQINSFMDLGLCLKVLMKSLVLEGFTLSKYYLGTHVVARCWKRPDGRLSTVYVEGSCAHIDLFEVKHSLEFWIEYQKVLKSVNILQHSDFVYENNEMFKYVDEINLKKLKPLVDMISTNGSEILIGDIWLPYSQADIVSHAYRTRQEQCLRLDAHKKPVLGGRLDKKLRKSKYHWYDFTSNNYDIFIKLRRYLNYYCKYDVNSKLDDVGYVNSIFGKIMNGYQLGSGICITERKQMRKDQYAFLRLLEERKNFELPSKIRRAKQYLMTKLSSQIVSTIDLHVGRTLESLNIDAKSQIYKFSRKKITKQRQISKRLEDDVFSGDRRVFYSVDIDKIKKDILRMKLHKELKSKVKLVEPAKGKRKRTTEDTYEPTKKSKKNYFCLEIEMGFGEDLVDLMFLSPKKRQVELYDRTGIYVPGDFFYNNNDFFHEDFLFVISMERKELIMKLLYQNYHKMAYVSKKVKNRSLRIMKRRNYIDASFNTEETVAERTPVDVRVIRKVLLAKINHASKGISSYDQLLRYREEQRSKALAEALMKEEREKLRKQQEEELGSTEPLSETDKIISKFYRKCHKVAFDKVKCKVRSWFVSRLLEYETDKREKRVRKLEEGIWKGYVTTTFNYFKDRGKVNELLIMFEYDHGVLNEKFENFRSEWRTFKVQLCD